MANVSLEGQGSTFILHQAIFKNPLLLHNRGLVPFVLIGTVVLFHYFLRLLVCYNPDLEVVVLPQNELLLKDTFYATQLKLL